MTAIDIANAQQRAASNPRVSAFVAASAGSGKTKLLTDRLLRLMLGGAAPEKILCLTYTKAAAAEMRIRLNKRLGDWVVWPPARLDAALRDLDVPVNATTRARARRLFADVLDLPGGMRIETIHAFCQSLLRRFPLEARLSPHFEVADDEGFLQRLREARETVLAAPDLRDAIFALAAETNEADFATLTKNFCESDAQSWQGTPPHTLAALQRKALGLTNETPEALLAQAATPPREDELRAGLRQLAEQGNQSGKNWALACLDWLALPPDARKAAWESWADLHFTTAGTPKTLHNFFGKKLTAEEPRIRETITLECQRIARVQDRLRAVQLADLNAHLAHLLAPIAAREREGKEGAAQLSYGDLISRTGDLLIDPGAAWVLFKLDGGIEHLLLDEVQDTAPAQWDIANAIAAEFFAGDGAQDTARSIFAVGDAKQSIFSFQGADLKSFGKYRDIFKSKALGARQTWLDGELSVSFRSSAPVLELTDAVFAAGPARAGVCAPDDALAHDVSRIGQAGRVTLWPATEPRAPTAVPAWDLPEDYERVESANAVLARDLAHFIAARLQAPLPSRGRLARPGDFLILVRRRNALVGAMTSALKQQGIPVAGRDRMVLTAQTAVSDLLALCDALLLPEDDLAFAHYLASPLGGLSDDSLMALALGRKRSLAATLQARAPERADWLAAWQFFDALRARADFLTPYALLAEALGPLGGRARLLRRLGAEAAEPIDELCAEALAFAQTEPGALQSFVARLRQSGASIRRESENTADEVRIMTVHGAKGLQAPIVILPDTTGLPDMSNQLFRLSVPGHEAPIPIFCPRTEMRPSQIAAAARAERDAAMAEYNRLLYVALTRAEDECLICGTLQSGKLPEESWYETVRAGFARLGAHADEQGALIHECAQTAAPDRASTTAAPPAVSLPAWAGQAPDWQATPLARETQKPERIAPSRGTEDPARQALAASPLEPDQTARRAARAAAMARGVAVHALLQHLPDIPRQDQAQAALRYLMAHPDLAPDATSIRDSALRILHDPALAPLFGPGSRAEVPLAGVVGDVEIGGLADRLAITPEGIWLADYKTDRSPPAEISAIPAAYIAQLAAYRAILRQIHPHLPLTCLLIWTTTATAMSVPGALLDGARPA